MRAQLSTRDYEQLSAYLDGQLASGEQKKLEARISTRPELQEALEDLRQTRALLRMAPRKRAPRNFTLTPAMVGDLGLSRKAARPAEKRGWGGFQLFPALSFASALTLLLLVAVLLFDFGGIGTQKAASVAQAPAAPAAAPANDQSAVATAVAKIQAGSGTQPSTETSRNAAGAAAPQATAAPALPDSPAVAAAKPQQPYTGPLIQWGGGYGMGGGGSASGMATGMGGGGGGGGGGASNMDPKAAIENQYGLNSTQGGNLVVPPEAAQSLPKAAAPLAEQQAAHPNPAITGGGPILGIPTPEQGGKIISEQAALGHPDLVTPGPRAEAESQSDANQPQVQAPAPQAQNPGIVQPVAALPWYAQEIVPGLSILRLIEGVLLLIALATGITALILWRRRRA